MQQQSRCKRMGIKFNAYHTTAISNLDTQSFSKQGEIAFKFLYRDSEKGS